MWENTDQNNAEYGHFSRSGGHYIPVYTAQKMKFSNVPII